MWRMKRRRICRFRACFTAQPIRMDVPLWTIMMLHVGRWSRWKTAGVVVELTSSRCIRRVVIFVPQTSDLLYSFVVFVLLFVIFITFVFLYIFLLVSLHCGCLLVSCLIGQLSVGQLSHWSVVSLVSCLLVSCRLVSCLLVSCILVRWPSTVPAWLRY